MSGALNTAAVGLTTFDAVVTAGSVTTGAVALDGGSITTGAGQSYGAATLNGATTLTDTGHGAITFASMLGGGSSLTVLDAGGVATFAGTVDVGGALNTTGAGLTNFNASVTAASVSTGMVALDGGSVTTGAGQSYGAATLGTNLALVDSGGAIIFGGTLAGGGNDLTVTDAGGTVTFGGTVSGVGALDTASVGLTTFDSGVMAASVTTGAVALDGASVTTTHGQSYGAATLGTNVALNDSASAITFGGTLLASGRQPDVSDGAGGTVTFTGAVSGVGALDTSLAALTTFDGTVAAASVRTGAVSLDGGSVTTLAGQNYGAATLGIDTTLTDNGHGAITFASTLDGPYALTVSDIGGAVTFDGAVGHATALASLSATGVTAMFDGTVAVNGALNTAAIGLTTFTRGVTAASVTTGAAALDGGSVLTGAGQNYGAATLGAGTTLADTGGSAITFASTLDGNGNGLTVNDGRGTVTFIGAVSGLGPLDSSGTMNTVFLSSVAAASVKTGAAALDGGSVTTDAGQTYGVATLGAATTLTDTDAGAITFASTLDGTDTLIISDVGGAITFDGAVGHAAALASLSATGATAIFDGTVAVNGALNTSAVGLASFDNAVTAGSVATGAVALNGGSVTTMAGQRYGAATLGAGTILTDTGEGAITFASTLDGADALTISDVGGAIAFDGAVGHATALASLSATGATARFGGTAAVSGALNTTDVELTTFDAGVTAGSVTTGAVALDGGSVMTNAGQTYGAANLGAGTTLTDTAQGAITFASTLDGADALTINDAGGAITFSANVGHGAALSRLNATGATAAFDGTVAVNGALNTAATGLTTFDSGVTAGSVTTSAVALDGGSVLTSAGQTYGAATLGGDTTLTDNGHGAITFASTLDGPYALTIADAGGAITFDGAVGHSNALASLSTTGALAAFDGTVAVNGALSTAAAGLTTFDAGVTAGSVSTGAVALDGGSVTTNAGQSYGAATLGADTVLTDSGSFGISFGSTLDGAHALSIIDAEGQVTFKNSVGRTSPLASLDVGATAAYFYGPVSVDGALNTTSSGLTRLDGGGVTAGSVSTGPVVFYDGGVTTDAGQSYGPATFAANTILTDTGHSAIVFNSTVGTIEIDGLVPGLTVADAGGAVTFDDAVTLAGALNTSATGLTTFVGGVTAASVQTGAVALDGRGVTTSAGQTYGAATLGADTVLTKSGTAAITFTSTLDGAHALTISDFGGAIALDGAVGGNTALTNLTAAGTLITFDNSLALSGNLDTSGIDLTTFDGSVAAGSVLTAAVALDGGSVTTANGQSYGATTLGTDTVLHDSGGAISFGGALNGARNLTITDGGGSITFTGAVGGTSPLASLTASAATIAFGGTVAVRGRSARRNVG